MTQTQPTLVERLRNIALLHDAPEEAALLEAADRIDTLEAAYHDKDEVILGLIEQLGRAEARNGDVDKLKDGAAEAWARVRDLEKVLRGLLPTVRASTNAIGLLACHECGGHPIANEVARAEALLRMKYTASDTSDPLNTKCACVAGFYDGFGKGREAWLLTRSPGCSKKHEEARLT